MEIDLFVQKFNSEYFYFGAIVCALLFLISIFVYSSYNFFGQNLSDLGIGESAPFFNSAIILAGIFLAFFYLNLLISSKKLFEKIVSVSGIISAIALSGVGFFTLKIPELHYICAGTFFVLTSIILLIRSVKKFPQNIPFRIFELISSGTILFYLLVLRIPALQKVSVFLIVIWVFLVQTKEN